MNNKDFERNLQEDLEKLTDKDLTFNEKLNIKDDISFYKRDFLKIINKQLAILLSFFVLSLFCVVGYRYEKIAEAEVAAVQIDKESSFIISLNLYSETIKVDAINDAAKETIKNISFENMETKDVIITIVKLVNSREGRMIDPMFMSVICDNNKIKQQFELLIFDALEDYFATQKYPPEIVSYYNSSMADLNIARELGMSPQRMKIAKEYIRHNPELSFEDISNENLEYLILDKPLKC